MKNTTKYSDSYLYYKQLLLIQEPRAAGTKHTAKKAIKYWMSDSYCRKLHLCRDLQFIIILGKKHKIRIQAFWPKHNPKEDTPDYPNTTTNLLNSK